MGDSGVGKTEIFNRFPGNTIVSKSRIDIGSKNIEIESKIVVRAQILDISLNRESHPPPISARYRGAVGVLLVYDISDHASFENITQYLKEIQDHADSNIIKELVGNKSDLGHLRAVTTDEAREFALANEMSFIETSAFENLNVDLAFQNILTGIQINRLGISERVYAH
ncbi:hypothetical protein ABW20_dc0109989 [Dactylellina cionopaga]|nr:hypothetical protein ABW20_dc0109989 [Dactylellina cionopaga]